MNWKLTALLGSIFIFGVLENLFPFFSYKQNFFSRISTNFGLGLVNAIATSLSITLLWKWVWTQNVWAVLLPAMPMAVVVLPEAVDHALPWLAGILSLLLLDVYMYFWHRLMHEIPLGWRFHRVHHTDMSMNSSTAYRFHAIEVLLSNLPKIFIVWLFGIALKYLLLYEVLFTSVIVFHHSNLALPFKIDRFLSYFIVTPNYHRVHHSQIVRETNSNYASLFSIWDRVFKSFQYRQNPEDIKIGLIEEPRELNILNLLSLPF